jgi:hypothetical protein
LCGHEIQVAWCGIHSAGIEKADAADECGRFAPGIGGIGRISGVFRSAALFHARPAMTNRRMLR